MSTLPLWVTVADAKNVKIMLETNERTKKGKVVKKPVRMGTHIDMADGSWWFLKFGKGMRCPHCGERYAKGYLDKHPSRRMVQGDNEEMVVDPTPYCRVCSTIDSIHFLVPIEDSWSHHHPRVPKLNRYGTGPEIEKGKVVLLPETIDRYASLEAIGKAFAGHIYGPALLEALADGLMLAAANEAAERAAA